MSKKTGTKQEQKKGKTKCDKKTKSRKGEKTIQH
jgi:hypothetical protein